MPPNCIDTWPPSSAISAGPEPLKGMWRMLVPATQVQHDAHEMRRGADAARGVGEVGLLGERDQLRQGLGRHVGMDDQDDRPLRHHGDGGEVLQRVVGQRVEDRRVLVEGVVGQHRSVWPSGLALVTIVAPSTAVASGRLSMMMGTPSFFSSPGCSRRARMSGAAARRARHDELDRLRRILGLGARPMRARHEKARRRGEQPAFADHDGPRTPRRTQVHCLDDLRAISAGARRERRGRSHRRRDRPGSWRPRWRSARLPAPARPSRSPVSLFCSSGCIQKAAEQPSMITSAPSSSMAAIDSVTAASSMSEDAALHARGRARPGSAGRWDSSGWAADS